MPRRVRGDTRDGEGRGTAGDDPEPLVNRTLELDLLRDHLSRVLHGEAGHGVVLIGESGVGKSRLVHEVLGEASRLGMRTITTQCLGRGAEPLLPLRDALANHLGRSPDRIRRTLVGAAPRLLDAIPFIGSFLGKIGETLVEGRQYPGAGLHGVYEQIARILFGIAAKGGLCVVVEDLHAADQDTLHFVHYFLKKIRGHRVLALATIQEEQLHDAPQLADLMAQWTADGYAVLTVLPLERAHVGEYVRTMALLGSSADEALVDRLFTLTGGNPFFLKETLRLFADETAEAGGSGTSPGDRPLQPSRIPARAEAVLQRRLARADAATRQFLEAAAVVLDTGQELEPVAYVLDLNTGQAVRALTEARRLHLMREGPQGEIGFLHALMQRAVYAEMGENYRRHLHGRAAEWFERSGRFASAAFHYERAQRTGDMVRTALEAASRAEQAGMYHSALVLYQKVRPFVELEQLGPRLGRALIVLGDWRQAQELVERLPADDGRVRLLRSELRFALGDFRGAANEAEQALRSHSIDRVEALIRMADIALHLGEFPDAMAHGREALDEAERSGSVNQRARCLGILGATTFYAGDIGTGERHFTHALETLVEASEDERNRALHATVLGNLGSIAEARCDWAAAERYHAEALRLRREVADAPGAVHSLHILGLAKIERGEVTAGMADLDEGEQLAVDLDETLGRAKIMHTRARLLLRDGDLDAAERLAATALETFSQCATRYDVTHALLTLSDVARRRGREREAVERGATARAVVATKGYGLLTHLYPHVAFPVADRIAAAIVAYACGDALGLPWEGHPPAGATQEEVERLPARPDWPPGATSDDTALTMLVTSYLAERDGAGDARTLLAAMADQAASIRGLGPSTTRAIERFRETGELSTTGGDTNGAAMRAMPVGWVTPIGMPDRRRALAIELSRATHPSANAQCAACVVAACAAWAVEGASPDLLLEVAVEEAAAASRACGADPRLADTLASLKAGTWTPPPEGVSLDPYETVAAALACVVGASCLREALGKAVSFGGDTDTVAALAGGLLGAGKPREDVCAELPWHTAVLLPGSDTVAAVSAALATSRASTSASA